MEQEASGKIGRNVRLDGYGTVFCQGLRPLSKRQGVETADEVIDRQKASSSIETGKMKESKDWRRSKASLSAHTTSAYDVPTVQELRKRESAVGSDSIGDAGALTDSARPAGDLAVARIREETHVSTISAVLWDVEALPQVCDTC